MEKVRKNGKERKKKKEWKLKNKECKHKARLNKLLNEQINN